MYYRTSCRGGGEVVTFKPIKRKKQEKGKNEKEQVDTRYDAFSLADEVSNFNYNSLHLEQNHHLCLLMVLYATISNLYSIRLQNKNKTRASATKEVNIVPEAVPVCPVVRYISDTGVPFWVYCYYFRYIYIYILDYLFRIIYKSI